MEVIIFSFAWYKYMGWTWNTEMGYWYYLCILIVLVERVEFIDTPVRSVTILSVTYLIFRAKWRSRPQKWVLYNEVVSKQVYPSVSVISIYTTVVGTCVILFNYMRYLYLILRLRSTPPYQSLSLLPLLTSIKNQLNIPDEEDNRWNSTGKREEVYQTNILHSSLDCFHLSGVV